MKPSTINYRLACLGTVFKFHGIPDLQNPLKGLRRLADAGRGGREQIIAEEEFARILASTNDPELLDFYKVLRYTGARADITAARLSWDDISFVEEKIHVPACKNKGKMGFKRAYDIEIDGRIFDTLLRRQVMCQSLTLAMAREMYPFLQGHSDLEIMPILEVARNYLFPSHVFREELRGHVKSYGYAAQTFRRIARDLGIKDVCLHDLRRTAATEYYARSNDIVATKDFLGHTDINTTQKYLHLKKLDRRSTGVQPVANNPFKKASGTGTAPEANNTIIKTA